MMQICHIGHDNVNDMVFSFVDNLKAIPYSSQIYVEEPNNNLETLGLSTWETFNSFSFSRWFWY